MAIPVVNIIVADNGANAATLLPQTSIQVVIGCATGGVVNQPTAASQPATLVSSFTGGPLVEAAGLVCRAGGTVIACSVPIVTMGTATAVVATIPGTSTSTVTTTLDVTNGAWDDYNVMVKCVTGGTRGTAGIFLQVSLDAGRNFGAPIALGTATTLSIPNTGITINFGVGTLVAGDYWRFSTTAPAWNVAGIQAALNTLANSQYGIAGWGSLHIVGSCSAANAATIQTYMDAMFAKYIFSRAIVSAPDALNPVAWGGAGQTESAWMASITTSFASNATNRLCVGAGAYNTPSPFPNALAGTPSYRRSISWSDAVRRVLVPAQRRGGRVKDGALSTIVVSPATDPTDGFVYHDERATQGLDVARFMTAITWPKQAGFFICHENLMSQIGSQYTDLTLGNVVDVACQLGYLTGVQEINDDLRLLPAGTLYPTDALGIQNTINQALSEGMTNVSMVSGAYSSVSQTANVRATGNIPIAITVNPRGYANTITETINLSN